MATYYQCRAMYKDFGMQYGQLHKNREQAINDAEDEVEWEGGVEWAEVVECEVTEKSVLLRIGEIK